MGSIKMLIKTFVLIITYDTLHIGTRRQNVKRDLHKTLTKSVRLREVVTTHPKDCQYAIFVLHAAFLT